uniref:PWWP domain-containing protein n=1 Tax=Electrophorus electricus TaxID=8005 RepID=A0A4W4H386_ELEEL
MPEPKNPTSMKQLSDSPGGCKGRGDGSTDPALLMDKAATQLAATPQDSVLQILGNHNHTHERLKDLTSRLLNGDQDKIPKLYTAPAAPPILKGVESGPQHDGPQRKADSSPELTLKITKRLANGNSPPPSSLYEGSYGEEGAEEPDTPLSLPEGILASPSATKEGRKRKRAPVRKRTPPNRRHPTVIPAAIGSERSSLILAAVEPCDQFSVGDVVWTKESGYPWWPCMITTDPEFNLHFKQKGANSRTGLSYHIQYFSDTPEIGYIAGKNMVVFSDKDQYQTLCRGNKEFDSHAEVKKFSIPRKLRTPWETGISQATEAVALPLKERLARFTFAYEDGQPRFGPRMQQELQQGQAGQADLPGTASLTPPSSSHSSPLTVEAPSISLPLHAPADSSTSTGKMPLATKASTTPAMRGQGNQHNVPARRRRRKKVLPPAVSLPHADPTVQVRAVWLWSPHCNE